MLLLQAQQAEHQHRYFHLQRSATSFHFCHCLQNVSVQQTVLDIQVWHLCSTPVNLRSILVHLPAQATMMAPRGYGICPQACRAS